MPAENCVRLTDKQQYWLEHIQQAKTDHQPLTDYAKQHALDLKALYNYHWLLRKKGLLGETATPSNFVKATRHVKAISNHECMIAFPNGYRVAITVHEDDLLSVLKQVSAL